MSKYRKPILDKFVDAQTLGARNFIKTLSYREFVSAISLSLLLAASYHSIKYYGSEYWIRDYLIFILIVIFSGVTLLNHIFYKIEHKRSNNFFGRSLHDFIYVLCYAIISQIVTVLVEGELAVGGFFGDFFVISFFAVLFEIVISILKRIFNLFRWQPF